MTSLSFRTFAAADTSSTLQWSEDNQLGIAAQNIINIFHPPLLNICRGSVEIDYENPFNVGKLIKGGELYTLFAIIILFSFIYEILDDAPLDFFSRFSKEVSVLCFAWSPSGLGANASSILAVCSDAGFLSLFGPTQQPMSSNWTKLTSISKLWYKKVKPEFANRMENVIFLTSEDFRLRSNRLYATSVAWSINSAQLLMGTMDGKGILWAVGKIKGTHVTRIDWGEKCVAAGGSDGSIVILTHTGIVKRIQKPDLRPVKVIILK
ncbi:MAG: hypothetical protein EZS28_006097 [Streblomastix strix]|uniref:Transcription factor IIIC 90kDa subunit N-terminal domain-containing protein n=1 Tax=Streblomastix strix TaxID=222440 RepID=A0A5J4WTS2_9EUKA|nr:MAG: hypothetical protein EZS28_006097 [Streblomastix strix]